MPDGNELSSKRRRRAPDVSKFAPIRFKAFSTEARVQLRPITLLYGENSSGKSSLLQSLLLLQQSLDLRVESEPVLESRGPTVNLGPYRELIYRHRTAESLEYEFDVAPRGVALSGLGLTKSSLPMRVGLSFGQDRKSGRALLQKVTIRTHDSDRELLALRYSSRATGFRWASSDYDHPVWQGVLRSMRAASSASKIDIGDLQRKLEAVQESLGIQDLVLERRGITGERTSQQRVEAATKATSGMIEQIRELELGTALVAEQAAVLTHTETDWFSRLQRTLATGVSGFLPTGPLRQDQADPEVVQQSLVSRSGPLAIWQVALAVVSELRAFLQSITYLGPLRDFPDRLYVRHTGGGDEVGSSGQYAPEILAYRPELVQVVNDALDEFGVGYEVHVARGSGPTHDLKDVFALRLKDRRSDVRVSLADVGFGVSQVLPVVVQSLIAQRRTVLIEQPEIHLHPRLQAELGSLFARAIKPPYENRFVLETHSEHLLLRLQRLIRLGVLRASDVGVVYVRRGRWASVPLEMRLDDGGQLLDQWPGGFFEESYREVFDLDAD